MPEGQRQVSASKQAPTSLSFFPVATMSLKTHVAVFWDYENCRPPSNASGYAVVDGILKAVQHLGSIILFKAYVELTLDTPNNKSMLLHSELQSSGVSLTHCPHNGRKDVADKMMIADMLAFAIDNPAPATVVIITGDRDFAYAASLLKLRGYTVVLIVPLPAHMSLKMQATTVIDWQREVLGLAQLQRERVLGTECSTTVVSNPKNLSMSSNSTTSEKFCDIAADPTMSALTESCTAGSATGGSSKDSRLKVDLDTFSPSRPSSQILSRPSRRLYASQNEMLSFSSMPDTRTQLVPRWPSPPITSDSLTTPTSIDPCDSHACDPLSSPHDVMVPGVSHWESGVNDSQTLSENTESDAQALKNTLRDVVSKGFQSSRPRQTLSQRPSVLDDNWTWYDMHGDHDWNINVQPESTCSEPHRTAMDAVTDHVPNSTAGIYSENYSQPAATLITPPDVTSTIPPKCNQAVKEESSEASVQSANNGGESAPSAETGSTLSVQDLTNKFSALMQQPSRLFDPLIDLLKAHEKEGIYNVKSSQLGAELLAKDKDVYERVGVNKLRPYVEMAAFMGLVKTTKAGPNGEVWVELAEGLQRIPAQQQHNAEKSHKGKKSLKKSQQTQQTEDPFQPLLALLSSQGASGAQHMPYSRCGEFLQQRKPGVYHEAGVSGLKQYLKKAQDKGIVVLGGTAPRQWVAMKQQTGIQ